MRRCHTCLCHSCLNICDCKSCKGKIESCSNYKGFKQISIFEQETKSNANILKPDESKFRSAPRYSWERYGISKERYRKLSEYIRSGRYANLASHAAHMANETIAECILLSVTQNKSYDALRVKWELKEMERIPYCRTDFYGIRRYFYHLFDLEIRRNGE